MSFDWRPESKERYFQKAERKIKEAGFDDILSIDRTAFGTVRKDTVKVYMKKVHRKGNAKRWREAKKEFPELKECEPPKNRYGRKEKTIFLKGYFELEME